MTNIYFLLFFIGISYGINNYKSVSEYTQFRYSLQQKYIERMNRIKNNLPEDDYLYKKYLERINDNNLLLSETTKTTKTTKTTISLKNKKTNKKYYK